MPSLTIRNGLVQLVKSLRALASGRRRLIEQDLRELPEDHRAERRFVLSQIEAGWQRQTRRPTAKDVDTWIGFGRS